MVKIEPVIKTLSKNSVEFVIVGGIAIRIHSASYSTFDFDFCYKRTKENLFGIVIALSPFNPRPRDFPDNLPFIFDQSSLSNGTNFTFETDLGDIDLLGEVAGLGIYDEVKAAAVCMPLFGFDVWVLSVEGLIKAKRAAGRTKDLLVLPELETLLEVQNEEDND
jgi:predicted nucleotidyltransferase